MTCNEWEKRFSFLFFPLNKRIMSLADNNIIYGLNKSIKVFLSFPLLIEERDLFIYLFIFSFSLLSSQIFSIAGYMQGNRKGIFVRDFYFYCFLFFFFLLSPMELLFRFCYFKLSQIVPCAGTGAFTSHQCNQSIY